MSIATLQKSKSEEIELILETARNRARARGLYYRGALLPEEAWSLFQSHPKTKLVDIRSSEEWELIGSIPGAIQVQWKFYPDWNRNPLFLDQLEAAVSSDDFIILICRSGVRSSEAAQWLTQEGYSSVFNVLEGFEGDKNETDQRIIGGWKVRGLPWSQ